MKLLTMGSLFSGAGGWELGAMLNGIRPVWSSEIELLPLRVTTKRFPWVAHLGDINTIDGRKVEPVDIITLSSPCQDYAEQFVIPKFKQRSSQVKGLQ
ncbi:hypothetical protein FACS18948_4400 [Clostridia bacterium]|nr:hypothetical protein FACS18948_4400 [Clostridia bacterium]